MSRTIHMCVSVRGMLRWSNAETKRNLRSMTKDDGSKFTSVDEFRSALMDQLSRGREVLPLGAACDGFDYKVGCPGHETSEGSQQESE
jgi:hypothetical protein